LNHFNCSGGWGVREVHRTRQRP